MTELPIDSKISSYSKSECSMFEFCDGCAGNYCCFNSNSHNCNDCINSGVISFIKKNKPSFLDDLLNERISQSKYLFQNQDPLKLPDFIARIQINSKKKKQMEMETINASKESMVLVTMKNLISNKKHSNLRLKENFNQDLHEILNYNGKIILSLNIPNKNCIRLINSPEKSLDLIKILNPDIVTGFDADFYYSNPVFLTKLRLIQCYTANLYLSKLKIPIIPFYYPLPSFYSKFQFKYITTAKPRIIAIPTLEFRGSRKIYNDTDICNEIFEEISYLRKIPNLKIFSVNESPFSKKRIGDMCSSHCWRNTNYSKSYGKSYNLKLDNFLNPTNNFMLKKSTISNYQIQDLLKLERTISKARKNKLKKKEVVKWEHE